MLDILSSDGKKKIPKSLCFFKAFGLKSIFTTALARATPLSAEGGGEALESRFFLHHKRGGDWTEWKAALHTLRRLPCLLSLLQACLRVLFTIKLSFLMYKKLDKT